MFNLIVTRRKCLIWCVNIIFLLVTIFCSLTVLTLNHLGVSGHFSGQNWIIYDVDPDGYAYTIGIVPGDIVLRVDDKPLVNSRSLTIWERFVPKNSVEIQHPGDLPRVIKFSAESRQANFVHNLPLIASGLFFWLLGNYALYSKPSQPLAWKIFYFTYLCGLVLTCIPAVSRTYQLVRDIEFAGIMGAGPCLAVLLGDLPSTPKLSLPKAPLQIPGILIFGFYLSWENYFWQFGNFYGLVKMIFLGYVLFWVVTALILLLLRMLRSGLGNRYKFIISLVLIAIAFMPLLSLLLPDLAEGVTTPVSNLDLISLGLIPLALWWVLSRDKFFDLSFFIRQVTLYLLIGIPSLAVFTWLLVRLYNTTIIDTLGKAAMVTFVSVLTLFMYSLFREKILITIEKNLFADYYARKMVIKEFQTNLLKIHTPELLINSLIEVISTNFTIADLFICLKEDGVYVVKNYAGKCYDKKVQANLLAYLEDLIIEPGADQELNPTTGMEYLMPLHSNQELIGVLVLGAMHGGIKLGRKDVITIRSLVDNFCIGLENAKILSATQEQFDLMVKEMASISQSNTESNWLNRMLIAAQEEERKKLALELHDGPTQLVTHLIRLGQKTVNQDWETEKMQQKLKEQIEVAKDVLYDLRELCFRLRPSLLDDLGLVPTLEWLVNETKRTYNLEVDFYCCQSLEKMNLHKEVELAVFRAVQEIVNNTLKHAEASHLSISLGLAANRLLLACRDNGRGFTPDFSLELMQTNHLGLLGLKKRIDWLGGNFLITSSPGKGTEINIDIPVAGGRESLVVWNSI